MWVSIFLCTIALGFALVPLATAQTTTVGVYFDSGANTDEMFAVDGVPFNLYFILTAPDIESVLAIGFAYALTVTSGASDNFTRLAEFLPPLNDTMTDIVSDDPWTGYYFCYFETPLPVVGGSVVLFSWEVILGGDIQVDIRLGSDSIIGPPALIDGVGEVHYLTAASGAWEMPVAHIIGQADPTPVTVRSFGQLKCIFR